MTDLSGTSNREAVASPEGLGLLENVAGSVHTIPLIRQDWARFYHYHHGKPTGKKRPRFSYKESHTVNVRENGG